MDDFKIDEKSGVPVWVQLRNRLLFLITSGYYSSGSQLPTVHKMAIKLKINYNTVGKVYQSLERDGYITTRRGQGSFVADISQKEDHSPSSTADLVTDEYLLRMVGLGLMPADIKNLIDARLERLNKQKGNGDV